MTTSKDQLVKLIEDRCAVVLETNGLNVQDDEQKAVQYAWVKGIYDDLIEIIKVSL